MNQGKENNAARRRERAIMRVLARVVTGDFVLPVNPRVDHLRQLGYAAQLARGRVADPDQNLLEVVRVCRSRLTGLPVPEVSARDSVQAAWGAPWHLDAAKLRTELPQHVSKALADKELASREARAPMSF